MAKMIIQGACLATVCLLVALTVGVAAGPTERSSHELSDREKLKIDCTNRLNLLIGSIEVPESVKTFVDWLGAQPAAEISSDPTEIIERRPGECDAFVKNVYLKLLDDAEFAACIGRADDEIINGQDEKSKLYLAACKNFNPSLRGLTDTQSIIESADEVSLGLKDIEIPESVEVFANWIEAQQADKIIGTEVSKKYPKECFEFYRKVTRAFFNSPIYMALEENLQDGVLEELDEGPFGNTVAYGAICAGHDPARLEPLSGEPQSMDEGSR